MSEVEWANLKAHELRRLAEQDAVVLVPVAAMEQHGPHLPVQVDTRLAGEISRRTAERASAQQVPTITLPVVWHGLSEHHMVFGGTITLDPGTFHQVLRGIVGSVGNGAITVQEADGKNSLVLFHQTLAAELDATLFLDPEVEAGLASGPGIGPMAVALGTDERIVSVSSMAPLSRRALPIGAYYENGHLSQGVHLFTRTAAGERSHVVLDSIGGIVTLRQVAD